MTKCREKLIDRMTAIYGFENPIVIDFCRLCEDWESTEWNDKVLTIMVGAHEADPVIFEEE